MGTEDPGLEDAHTTIMRTCRKLGLRAERVDDELRP